MRLLKFILVPLALAMFSVSVTESAPPSAAIDDEYPDFTTSEGTNELWGSGFSKHYFSGTSVKLEGSLQAQEDGVEISGGGQVWKQQEWRGEIENATDPRWEVHIDGTVRVHNYTQNHYPHADYDYSADSTARLRFTGHNTPLPVTTHEAEVQDLDFQPEQKDEPPNGTDDLDFGNPDVWEREHAEVKFFLKAAVNGNIATERTEMFVKVEAYLEEAPDGTVKAFDGDDEIENGEFQIE